MGRLGRALLDELLMAMSAKASDPVLEEKVLVLFHVYGAILHQGSHKGAAESSQGDARTSNEQWEQIKRRLQLAEAGRWKQ
eukprot:9632510-Karenia_brevis.AAC.1